MVINNVNTKLFESTLIPAKINGHDTNMLVDSGSVANIIDYGFFKKIRPKENRIESSSVELIGTNSSQQEVVGETTMPIEIDDQTFSCIIIIVTIIIIKDLVQPLMIGVEFFKAFEGVLDFKNAEVNFN